MNKTIKSMLALVATAALSLASLHAQDDGALIDALVKKGILTDQESEDIRAQLVKDYANSPAGKLQIGSYVKQISFYGDGRLRFENQHQIGQAQTATGQNAGADVSRFRYRLRLEADYAYSDNLKAGFELESSTKNDSANQSFGAGFDKYAINVGKIFVSYKAADWATITAGKFNNPLYTTDMVWDPDINPEGAAEVLSFDPTDSLNIGLTSAQFLYAGQANSNGTNNQTVLDSGTNSASLTKSNVWILAEQVPVTWKITKDISVKFAPGVEFYTGGSNAGPLSAGTNAANLGSNVTTTTGTTGTTAGGTITSNGTGGFATGPGTSTVTATSVVNASGFNAQNTYVDYHAGSNLLLLTAPGEINLKVFGQNVKPYWDFSYNAQGEKKAQDYFSNAISSTTAIPYDRQNIGLNDNIAWLAGVQVGQLKKRGDWQVKADYRQVGLTAVDPNLTDSDYNNGKVNGQGVKASAGYQFTDALSANVTYFNNWAYKSNLFNTASGVPSGTEVSNVTGNANNHNYQDVQVDLVWKF